MELQKKMEYAITLSAIDFQHEYEDIFKLASLCDDIGKLKQEEAKVSQDVEVRFFDSIMKFYQDSGIFRQEIERFAHAKKLFQGI